VNRAPDLQSILAT